MRARIQASAVIGGILGTLAMMFLFMSLAAALGLWSYQYSEPPSLGQKFWIVASAAWIISVLLGTMLTSMSARATFLKDGIINSLVAWSGAYLLFGGISLSLADFRISTLLGVSGNGLFWHGFLGDFFSLIAAVIGGVLGVLIEKNSFRLETSKPSNPGQENLKEKFGVTDGA